MLDDLNSEQLEAATSDERTILVLAGAGCGKTKTLLARVEYLIKEKGVDPKSILCLTFTNAAAFEMKERYKLIAGLDISRGTPEFRTFHSFCYSLIIKDMNVRSRLGYTQIPQLCENEKMKSIRAKVKQAIGCTLTDAQLENGKCLTRNEQEDRKLFNKALIKEIKKQNVITFDIMCYSVCELFQKNDESIQFYKEKYKYIFVDEFQDSDTRQFQFVGSFPETTNFWFCGDALQCQPAGTMIQMSSGELKPIEKIKPGDQVVTYDANNSGTYSCNKVLETGKRFADNIVEIKTANHTSKYTTDHITYCRVRCNDSTSESDIIEIRVGEIIPECMDLVIPIVSSDSEDRNIYNSYEQIESITSCDPDCVYSLDVEEHHNYIADGILTHNCIYQFRGTTNKFVKQLATAPGWKVIKLYTNYRSTRQICDFANKFSVYANESYRIEMEGKRDGDKPKVIYGSTTSYNNPVDQDHLSILIDELRANNRESAVLCRSNRECNAVRNALSSAGIKYSSRSKESNAVNLLESALSNEYMLDWLSSKLESTDYADYIRLSSLEKDPDIRWFLNLYGNNMRIKPLAEKIMEIRNITASNEPPEDKFYEVAKLLRSKTKCNFEGTDETSNRELIESLRDQIQELEEAQVYCGTIHSVKGLEYDTVYVMGVDNFMFELGDEEMNNLLYVAMTRAKEHLTIFRR